MSTMSGGKRKSRKPQKWEDYVADEEQLASIEKELEKEEKARMQNLDDDDSNKDRESEEDVKEEDEGMREDKERRMSEDEMQLEIDMSRGEEDQDLGECERRSKEESKFCFSLLTSFTLNKRYILSGNVCILVHNILFQQIDREKFFR